MSYCRFVEADAYIFWSDDVPGGHPSHLECMWCSLTPNGYRSSGGNYRASSFTSMLNHVAAHRRAGHNIPEYVDAELARDRITYDDDPTQEVVS